MSQKKKQSYLQGAFILAVGTIIVKIIGVFFKMPLSNLLGGVGGSYFTAAYTIFNIIYSLAVTGFPVAISKMVSENMVLGRYRDVKKVLRVSLVIFSITSTIFFLVMFFGAGIFSNMIRLEGAKRSIMALSPAIVFTCVMAAYRGYYQGLQNMYPTAISQVIEAIVKLAFGILFSYSTQKYAVRVFEETGKVFGTAFENSNDAMIEISTYSAAAAILGITFSTLMGLIFIYCRHLFVGDKITKQQLESSPRPKSAKLTAYKMLTIAIPICLGAIAVNITTFIDTVSVMSRLEKAMAENSQLILSMFDGLIPNDMPISEVASYLYGSYSMFSVSIFNLVPALTATIGISALPMVSAAFAKRSKSEVKSGVESVLRVTAMISIPAGLGISFMAEPITQLLYYARPMEAQIAAMLLRTLGVSSILVALTAPLNSMLQAIGKVTIPVKLMLFGGVIKLVINYIFVAIPSLNIMAVTWGTLACYTFLVTMSIFILFKNIRAKFDVLSIIIKPAFCGLLCGISAWVSYDFINKFWQSKLVLFISIIIGGIIYAISMILVKGIQKSDVLFLPKGEKIAKVLEKYSIIG
ncbi:MAG: polysaccharide biosynthesis protein [Oscillospiraceae bacterium]